MSEILTTRVIIFLPDVSASRQNVGWTRVTCDKVSQKLIRGDILKVRRDGD